MRTTLNVDDSLFPDLMHLTRARTKTEAVRLALREFVRQKRKEQLLALRGKLDLVDNWRELRARDTFEADGG